MAAGRPAGEKLEIEYTAGVWTDVSIDSMDDPFTISRGRTSEFSAPSTGQLSGLRLKNTNGQYTPLSQVLADGTANPNYPNIVPRKRIRYSNTPAGVRGVFSIKGWPAFVDENGTAWVSITATDRLDQLSRITLTSPILQETRNDGAVALWPLTDAVGSSVALEASGFNAAAMKVAGSVPAVVFGGIGPGSGDGTGCAFAAGQYLQSTYAPPSTLNAFTLECWVNTTASSGTMVLISADVSDLITINASGKVVTDFYGVRTSASSVNDGNWHHIFWSYDSAANSILYIDGTAESTSGGTLISGWSSPTRIGVPGSNTGRISYTGSLGYFAVYVNVALSAAQALAHFRAGRGYTGDTTDVRISRWLAAGGLTSGDWTLDTGVAVVNTYPQSGKDIVTACQDMATTEGSGAVFYVGTDGKARFASRTYRKPAAPVMTIDAEADMEASPFAPSFDELTLFNQSTANRAAQSGTLSTQTYTNSASQAKYGLTVDGSGITSYSTTDQDVLFLAQSRVAGNAFPGYRLPQIAVDLVTAQNNLYASLANVQIGSRIRVTNLPAGKCPATQLDLIVEGWTETISPDTYLVVFDTSPADNPARGLWEDASYGRWGTADATLNANITNSATTLAITTTTRPFTTVSARYPMKITIGQERITLNNAPGATSPQTFTGVTRGVDGTSAAAQTSGTAINLAPAATWSL
jgi:hypothetical protein